MLVGVPHGRRHWRVALEPIIRSSAAELDIYLDFRASATCSAVTAGAALPHEFLM
jgi:hypothetical protein